MTRLLYRWLPLLFGCHCRSDRSFFWRGKQFPLCARCTGELIGILWGVAAAFYRLPSVRLCLLLMLPLLVDGFAQRLTRYESKNGRRLVTGLLFGYSLFSLLAITTVFSVRLGYQWGLRWNT